MLLVLLAAAVTATTADAPSPGTHLEAVRQARATVRILSGARVTAERIPAEALVRDTRIVASDGSEARARFVEFP